MIDHDIAAELDALAQAIARMKPPSNRNPHAFHEDRSELASMARAIARRCRNCPPPPVAADVPAPVGRQSISRAVRSIEGREVEVVTRRLAFLAH